MTHLRDFLKEAEKCLEYGMKLGSANGDVNVFDEQILVGRSVLRGLIEEIKRLRADVVVTRTMAGFREIKQEIKNGPSV